MVGAGDATSHTTSAAGMTDMNLDFWLPTLFVLGVVSTPACLTLAEGCSRI
jgi:hypothetical protein